MGGRAARFGALAAAAVVVLAACTSGASSASGDAAVSAGLTNEIAAAASTVAAPEAERDTAVAAAAAPGAEAGGAEAGSAAAVPEAPGLVPAPSDGSKVIRTADLSVKLVVEPVPATGDGQADRDANASARAAAIAQAGVSARGIATAAGGFQSSADGGGSQLSLGLRVPAEQYDAVVDKLAVLGDLTNRTESSQDVTGQVADVNSRVDSMTASVARVRALLAAATDIADVISIESELAVREANLESLQQQQAALSGQVALSTISLTLTAVTKDVTGGEPVVQDSGFVAGLHSGWSALLGFLGGFAGFLGAVLPFLPFIAAAGLLLWWLIRLTRGHRQPPSGAPGQAAEQYPA
jgi:hypothetical protein